MSLGCCSLSSSKDHGDWERFKITGRRQTSNPFSGRANWKIEGTTGWTATLQSQEDHGANSPESHFHAYEGQEDD